jgi:hypothetical protein
MEFEPTIPASETAKTVHVLDRAATATGFVELLQNVTTNNYDSLTESHPAKITVTTAHIKSSQSVSSPVVAW